MTNETQSLESEACVSRAQEGTCSSFVIRRLRHHHLQLLAATGMFLWLAAVAPGRLAAQSSPYTPYQHKALYLFNFAKYTEWPKEAFASDDAPFVIGILGADPFGKDIEIIKGKTIKGRKLEVRNILPRCRKSRAATCSSSARRNRTGWRRRCPSSAAPAS